MRDSPRSASKEKKKLFRRRKGRVPVENAGGHTREDVKIEGSVASRNRTTGQMAQRNYTVTAVRPLARSPRLCRAE